MVGKESSSSGVPQIHQYNLILAEYKARNNDMRRWKPCPHIYQPQTYGNTYIKVHG